MEATTPELGPVGFWSPQQFLHIRDSTVVEEATKNFHSMAKYEQVTRNEFVHSA